ncbi:hypothetical protein FQA39_LY12501 [Lamprigera yunnana]|nr:hypothetical protein FQA39_LY12501 [Lamprigera yunnana]
MVYNKNESTKIQERKAGEAYAKSGEDVVITGMAGRFPLSENLQEFQKNLLGKVHMPIQRARWYPIQSHQDRCGVINSIEKFDAGFFGVDYAQAEHMDPQVRLLMEHTFEAIVDAGYNPKQLRGSRVGVFIACNVLESNQKALFNSNTSFGLTGCSLWSLAQWISYYFNFEGPSVTLDTACSSALHAILQGYQAIKEGRCDNAIAGGSHLCLHLQLTNNLSPVLSPESTSRSYDNKANGFVRSEAVSVLFLQKEKLSRRIYAKVLHIKSATGCDVDVSFGCPSSEKQEELMSDVYLEYGVDLNDIVLMEGHGAGTVMGDPIEVEAMDNALCKNRKAPVYLVSTKSNVGHTEAVSGIASVIKVITCFEHEVIVPTLNHDTIKAGAAALEEGRLIVITDLTPWPKPNNFLAAVNNLGFGGCNSHALLKSVAEKRTVVAPLDDIPRLICVSGRTKEAVQHILGHISNTKINESFTRLLHEVFSEDVDGHKFRGYVILSKTGELKRSIQEAPFVTRRISLVIGRPSLNVVYCARYLCKLQIFADVLQQMDEVLSFANVNVSTLLFDNLGVENQFLIVLLQIALLELLSSTGIQFHYEERTGSAVIAYGYAKKKFTLAQATMAAYHYASSAVDGSENCLAVKIGDSVVGDLTQCTDIVSFLTVLGSIYESGCNFHLHKLYPKVSWPACRGTPMIGSLLRWNHTTDWFVMKYSAQVENIRGERVIHLNKAVREWTYVEGHTVDDRHLVPATAYVYLVWETIAHYCGKELIKTPIQLESMQILQAISVSHKTNVRLTVSLHKITHKFEIEESGQKIFEGRFSTESLEEMDSNYSNLSAHSADQLIAQKDIYKEFRLRGYNYTAAFQGIQSTYVDVSASFIKWQDNWVVFMDNMLQGLLLHLHTRHLYVPVSLNYIRIDPEAHLEYMKTVGEDKVPASGFIEIKGINVVPMVRRRLGNPPLLEKYDFIPFFTKLDLEMSVQVCVQIVCENFGRTGKLKLIELVHTSKHDMKLLMPIIMNSMDEILHVKCEALVYSENNVECPNVTIVPKSVLNNNDTAFLVVTFDALRKEKVMVQVAKALQEGGMILTRELLPLDVEQLAQELHLIVIAIYQNENEQLALLRKHREPSIPKLVDFSKNEELDWLPNLQSALKNSNNEVTLFSQNEQLSGLPGFFNCLTLEYSNNVKYFAILDQAPIFNVSDRFYFEQMQKRLTANVYKNGRWGTFRFLKLDSSQPVETDYVVGEFQVVGNFSSFSWFQNKDIGVSTNDENIPIDVYYSALNFKDVMVASGRVLGVVGKEHDIGYEFSGKDKRGKRYMGIAESSALANGVSCHPLLLTEVPNSWSLEEAATIPIVYYTVIYSLIVVGDIKKGQSILIHCGAGGVGQAAINIALYYKCDVFITVGTQEKKEFISSNFPQISGSHIGNSRDTSFEQMVLKETKGRGVDLALNSLASEKLKTTLRCLARGGKLLEIGKYDATQNRQLNWCMFNKRRSMHGIMLDTLMQESIFRFKEVQDIFLKFIRNDVIKPLNCTVFTRDEVSDAFRLMSKGEHIGKVLVKIRNEKSPIQEVFAGLPKVNCNSSESYLIVGGLGGFGLELTNWLINRGAKNILLASRTGVQTGYQELILSAWKKQGVRIVISTSDVATKQGCKEMIDQTCLLGNIIGVFNLAVVLKDALIENMTKKNMAYALIPKSVATRHLDLLTREICPKLKYFVVFSSATCGKGNAGQTNYGMGNSIAERICEQRKADGFSAVAIQWGLIEGVGIVAEMLEKKKINFGNLVGQPISSCLNVLDFLLHQSHAVVSSTMQSKMFFGGEDTLETIVKDILGIANSKFVSLHSTFNELGLDSIATTTLKQILEREYDIFMTTAEIRELTLSKLSTLIEGSGFIEIKDVNVVPMVRRRLGDNTLLEKYDFIPFFTKLPLEERVQMCVQIVYDQEMFRKPHCSTTITY